MTRRSVPVETPAAGLAAHHDAEGAPRPLRRDAEINLGRILAAARDVFAEEGYDAPMEAIATRADVGVGTLYRRFPTKADLFNAVVESAQQRTDEIARDVLRNVDPGEAVFEFVRRCIAVPSVWRASVSVPPWGSKRGSVLARTAPLLSDIVERSKKAGTLRHDIDVTDIVILLMAVRSIADQCDVPGSMPSLRFLDLALDGLRPGHQPPAHRPLGVAELVTLLDRH